MAEEIDLKTLDLADLKTLGRRIAKAISKRHSDSFRKAREAAESAAREYGYSLDEITGLRVSMSGAESSDAKYRNPVDPGQTWSGRGRQPRWFKDALASGKARGDMAA
jgi:DNA-binding protein H-NS